jgi:iduronate 2-sulfatase
MKVAGRKSDAVVQSVDIFPTLCELAALPVPEFVHGQSLAVQLADPDAPGHEAYGYGRNAKTIRTDSHRMTLHKDGYIELYDHQSEARETKNVADQNSELCQKLKELISEKIIKQKSSL